MTCPNCRFPNQEGVSYCASCGSPLQAAAVAPQPQPPRPAYAAGGAQQPLKQGLAIASLVVGILSVPLMCLFGLGILTALVGLVLGVVALVKVGRAPQEYGGKGMAIGGVAASALCLLSVPIVAAIAIPSFLRARVSANEAAAIGDIRTVISAQAAYQSANGWYDTLECLASPQRCIPNCASAAPTFLDATLAMATVKSGYRRTFHPGPPPPPEKLLSASSPSSLASYAYVAVPDQRNRTGVRAFCGDASGRICFTSDGSTPGVENGACAESCPELR